MEPIVARPGTTADAPSLAALPPGTLWPQGKTPRPVETTPADGRSAWVGAWRGGRCVGRLRWTWGQATLAVVNRVVVADGEDADEVAPALLRAIRPALLGRRGARVYAGDGDRDRPLRGWLDRAGFLVARRKVFVERALPFEGAVDLEGCTLHTVRDEGVERFARALEQAAEGDPFEPEGCHDAVGELEELVRLAGDAFDPDGWWVVREDGRAAGVLLPQVRADRRDTGTLFYVGVLPAWRGRGLGRRLHALGLRKLGERGCRRYVGSTEARNVPMLAVFARNGCRETARQLFYEPAPAASTP